MTILTRRRLLSIIGSTGILHLAMPAGAAAPLRVEAYRNPGCGCCEAWAVRMKDAGFSVSMADDPDLDQRRAGLGIPPDLAGCHLALIGEKVFEGHVPPADIIAFLSEEREAMGLAVPGMPIGSPGMETGGPADTYDVVMFGRDGSRSVFARH